MREPYRGTNADRHNKQPLAVNRARGHPLRQRSLALDFRTLLERMCDRRPTWDRLAHGNGHARVRGLREVANACELGTLGGRNGRLRTGGEQFVARPAEGGEISVGEIHLRDALAVIGQRGRVDMLRFCVGCVQAIPVRRICEVAPSDMCPP